MDVYVQNAIIQVSGCKSCMDMDIIIIIIINVDIFVVNILKLKHFFYFSHVVVNSWQIAINQQLFLSATSGYMRYYVGRSVGRSVCLSVCRSVTHMLFCHFLIFLSVIMSIQSGIKSIQSLIKKIQSLIKKIQVNLVSFSLIFTSRSIATALTRDWCRVYGLVFF